MKIHTNHLLAAGTVVASLAAIGVGANSALASADTKSQTPPAQSANQIPHYTLELDRLEAEAKVLNTTPDQLKTDLKSQTMDQVLSGANLTKDTFRQKVEAEVKTELQSDGYSTTQIDSALQHHGHGRRHHPMAGL